MDFLTALKHNRSAGAKEIAAQEGKSLAELSTFRIGGRAALCLFPADREELADCLRVARETGVDVRVIGSGSNLLFDDEGYDGVLIVTGSCRGTSVLGNTVTLACGEPLSRSLYLLAERHSLGGYSSLYGIPGTVGGAAYINAGAFGKEFYDAVVSVDVFDGSLGRECRLTREEVQPSYRNTLFCHRDDLTVLGVTMEFSPVDKAAELAAMNEIIARRREKQPLEYPSAGSVFKRPKEGFAGKMIEDCGLKGFRIGDAAVSEKHAGFIVNMGNATSKDVKELIAEIQKRVYEQFGVTLEREIIYL